MNLVTGGAGYIGSHFIKRYLDTVPGDEIVTVDNLSEGHANALAFSPFRHVSTLNSRILATRMPWWKSFANMA
jgi:UDP-glucose 4-epimerase